MGAWNSARKSRADGQSRLRSSAAEEKERIAYSSKPRWQADSNREMAFKWCRAPTTSRRALTSARKKG